MKKTALAIVLVLAPALVFAFVDAERLKNAELTLTEMATQGDAGIPQSLLEKARCVVIVPNLTKVAFVAGGQFGRGYISCRRDGGWSGPAGVRIEGGSFGFQIGGSATDVILIVMNERGVEKLLANQVTLGGEAVVAAGPLGRQAAAQTDATMRAEMLAWSRSRGVFAGISLQGSTLREDTAENEWLYGRKISNREIVTGKVGVPQVAESFIRALSKY